MLRVHVGGKLLLGTGTRGLSTPSIVFLRWATVVLPSACGHIPCSWLLPIWCALCRAVLCCGARLRWQSGVLRTRSSGNERRRCVVAAPRSLPAPNWVVGRGGGMPCWCV